MKIKKLFKEKLESVKYDLSYKIANKKNKATDFLEWLFKCPSLSDGWLKNVRKGQIRSVVLYTSNGKAKEIRISSKHNMIIACYWSEVNGDNSYIIKNLTRPINKIDIKELRQMMKKVIHECYNEGMRGCYEFKDIMNFFATGYETGNRFTQLNI